MGYEERPMGVGWKEWWWEVKNIRGTPLSTVTPLQFNYTHRERERIRQHIVSTLYHLIDSQDFTHASNVCPHYNRLIH